MFALPHVDGDVFVDLRLFRGGGVVELQLKELQNLVGDGSYAKCRPARLQHLFVVGEPGEIAQFIEKLVLVERAILGGGMIGEAGQMIDFVLGKLDRIEFAAARRAGIRLEAARSARAIFALEKEQVDVADG